LSTNYNSSKTKSSKVKICPWMTKALLKSKRTNDKLYRKYISSRKPTAKQLYSEYNSYSVLLKRKSKRKYNYDLFHKNEGNIKGT
jgi:hypothetical protein